MKYFIMLLTCFSAMANQNNFQIAPSPLANPSYEEGKKNLKVSAAYLNLKYDSVSLSGINVQAAVRFVTIKDFAISAALPFTVLVGNLGTSQADASFTMMNWSPSFLLEYQYKFNDKFSLIGFGGLGINFLFSYYEMVVFNSYVDVSSYAFTLNSPIGLQGRLSIIKNFTLAPFILFNYNYGGVATVVADGVSSDTTIDGYSSISYGMDIIYNPWNLSVGTVLQQIGASSGSEEDVDIFMIQFSWLWSGK